MGVIANCSKTFGYRGISAAWVTTVLNKSIGFIKNNFTSSRFKLKRSLYQVLLFFTNFRLNFGFGEK